MRALKRQKVGDTQSDEEQQTPTVDDTTQPMNTTSDAELDVQTCSPAPSISDSRSTLANSKATLQPVAPAPQPVQRSWYSTWTSRPQPPPEPAESSSSTSTRPSTPLQKTVSSNSSIRTVSAPSPANRYFRGRPGGSVKSIPLAAATRIHAASDIFQRSTDMAKKEAANHSSAVTRIVGDDGQQVDGSTPRDGSPAKGSPAQRPLNMRIPTSLVPLEEAAPRPQPQEGEGADGWFSWWSRPAGYVEGTSTAQSEGDASKVDSGTQSGASAGNAKGSAIASIPTDSKSKDAANSQVDITHKSSADATKKPPVMATADASAQSWFWGWSLAHSTPAGTETAANPTTDDKSATPATNPESTLKAESSTPAPATSSIVNTSEVKPDPQDLISRAKPSGIDLSSTMSTSKKRSSGWAFWSNEELKSPEESRDTVQRQIGELAVANTPSQTHPEAAQFNEREENSLTAGFTNEFDKLQSRPPKAKSTTKGHRKTASLNDVVMQDVPSSSSSSLPSIPEPQIATQKDTEPLNPSQTKLNLVLPEITATLSYAPREPTRWQQVKQYFHSPAEKQSPPSHLFLTPDPSRIRKAIAIGVHGFFPSPIIQRVLGPPTGTSVKFANHAARAIKDWTSERGWTDVEIETVALEGEGFIASRVEMLWRLLMNWETHLRQADLIFVACHSQGVPVTIMLMAKLLEAVGTVVSEGARIGICAMAGVNMGPFVEYKTRLFGPSALELFDFSDPSSEVSRKYREALGVVLERGVRVAYIGSLDDQLVSLESSTFSSATHPYIYRAVFIDSRLHSLDFITHLISFTLKLRNLGLSDHGLIRELSPALAGSLYTGDGHSRLYDSPQLYALSLQHTLETTDLKVNAPLTLKDMKVPLGGSREANPFFLPWAMRGVLEEDMVRTTLDDECSRLLRLYDEWKPVSKGLKDIKTRLEVLKSKL